MDETKLEQVESARVLVQALAAVQNRSLAETRAYEVALQLLCDHVEGEA
jgi:hypothetical protein